MASAKMLKDQTVEVKLRANRSNNMLWGQDGDLSRACRDKRRRRLYSSGGGVEGSCHKQRQKVLGVFEILKYFQKADRVAEKAERCGGRRGSQTQGPWMSHEAVCFLVSGKSFR